MLRHFLTLAAALTATSAFAQANPAQPQMQPQQMQPQMAQPMQPMQG